MSTPTLRLAERVGRIDASGIRKVFDLAKSLKDPINLSIGQPDFDVPQVVKDAAIQAIQSGRNSYTPTQGTAELREQLLAEEARFTGRTWKSDEFLVTSGVSGGLFLALMALVGPGDEVIMTDPYFVMYKHLVRLFDGTPVYLDSYDAQFGIDPERLERLITPRTKVLLINSPANPTGRILSKAELQAIASVCDKHGLLVLSDEIYRSFAYQPFTSMAEVYPHTVVLGGHSKGFGMTGWRLGFAAGPAQLIQAMTKVQQYSFVCAPSVAQYAALACPQADMSAHLQAYRLKRDLMVAELGQHLNLAPADGAFYLWAEVPQGFSGTTFVAEAIKNNVLVIPGQVFSERDTHIRICYTVPDHKLRAGAAVLRSIVQAGPKSQVG